MDRGVPLCHWPIYEEATAFMLRNSYLVGTEFNMDESCSKRQIRASAVSLEHSFDMRAWAFNPQPAELELVI